MDMQVKLILPQFKTHKLYSINENLIATFEPDTGFVDLNK